MPIRRTERFFKLSWILVIVACSSFIVAAYSLSVNVLGNRDNTHALCAHTKRLNHAMLVVIWAEKDSHPHNVELQRRLDIVLDFLKETKCDE